MKTTTFVAGIFMLITLLNCNESIAQWSLFGNGPDIINTNSGNVLVTSKLGIGTTTPTTLLNVEKNMTEPTILIRNLGGMGGATYSMIDNLSGANWKFKTTSNGGFKIRDHSNSLDVFTVEPNSFNYAIYIKNSGSIGINTSTPDNSALVDLNSTTKGLLLPRLTSAQRDAISNPSEGLVIYNIEIGCLEFYCPSGWFAICGSSTGSITCTNPVINGVYAAGVTLTGSHTVTLNVDVPVPGPFSISTNTVNGYSFSKSGTFSTTGPQTVTLNGNGTPQLAGTNTFTVTFGSSSCNFDVETHIGHMICGSIYIYEEILNQLTSQTWLDRNLGAQRVAQSFDDYQAYGSLYQWGRLSDGHECMNWTGPASGSPVNGTTPVLATTDVPGHSLFIYNATTPADWRTPGNDNLWQGPTGINNPCPSGFRIPTLTELENERVTWSQQNYIGAFDSPLKFVTAGIRNTYNFGALFMTGSVGYVQSSTISGNFSQALSFSNSNAGPTQNARANGTPVRCIKN